MTGRLEFDFEVEEEEEEEELLLLPLLLLSASTASFGKGLHASTLMCLISPVSVAP